MMEAYLVEIWRDDSVPPSFATILMYGWGEDTVRRGVETLFPYHSVGTIWRMPSLDTRQHKDVREVKPSTALADVTAERRRQIEEEGWTGEHDDRHTDGSLALVGAAYALNASVDSYSPTRDPAYWPLSWDKKWWKPKDRRRDLVRAAALIIAEIERLDRAAK